MFSRFQVFRATLLLLTISVSCIWIQAQERAYLDTTQIQIRQRLREPATGSFGSVTVGYSESQVQSTVDQSLNLSLKLLGPAEISRGETFEYEVQIRNVSNKPVELPWDLSPANIEPADSHASYRYQTAAIVLSAKLEGHRPVIMEDSTVLFGAPSISSTMIKLQPGEWVRVKAKTRALSSNPNDTWPPEDLVSKQPDGQLTASLTLSSSVVTFAPDGNSHQASQTTKAPISSNVSTVQFRF
jgi:hypothetical protein